MYIYIYIASSRGRVACMLNELKEAKGGTNVQRAQQSSPQIAVAAMPVRPHSTEGLLQSSSCS